MSPSPLAPSLCDASLPYQGHLRNPNPLPSPRTTSPLPLLLQPLLPALLPPSSPGRMGEPSSYWWSPLSFQAWLPHLPLENKSDEGEAEESSDAKT